MVSDYNNSIDDVDKGDQHLTNCPMMREPGKENYYIYKPSESNDMELFCYLFKIRESKKVIYNLN